MKIKFTDEVGNDIAEVDQSHCPRKGEKVMIDISFTVIGVEYRYKKNINKHCSDCSVNYVIVTLS